MHWPLQAPEEDIRKFNTGDADRDIQLAMIHRMDIAVGKVITTLRNENVFDNTVIFYLSDNGGAKKVKANNLPLRDYKQSVYEGGLRVPFIMSWPAILKPSISDEPVISLDIMPTICALVGIDLPADRVYDGNNMLPAVSGELKESLHNELIWDGNQNKWSIRQGDWKLVSPKKGVTELYNLSEDIGEKNNLALQHTDKTAALKNIYDNWRTEMATPMGDQKKK